MPFLHVYPVEETNFHNKIIKNNISQLFIVLVFYLFHLFILIVYKCHHIYHCLWAKCSQSQISHEGKRFPYTDFAKGPVSIVDNTNKVLPDSGKCEHHHLINNMLIIN